MRWEKGVGSLGAPISHVSPARVCRCGQPRRGGRRGAAAAQAEPRGVRTHLMGPHPPALGPRGGCERTRTA